MTTPADDLATEAAFEAFLVGRVVPEQAQSTFDGVAAFAGAVRASATQPGRPNAALAELLATGLLTDQSSPSCRTAGAAGSTPSRRARVRRRRFAMFFPALLAKLLAAGAVAQAATGAGVVLVVATGAGATGLLGTDVQDTITAAVGADSGEVATDGDTAVTGDAPTADPAQVDGTAGEVTVPVQPVPETFDPEAWVKDGPTEGQTFGEWVSASAHKDELREWLRSKGKTFGSVVRYWAHNKGLDDADLAEEGVDPADLTDEPTTQPVTGGTPTGADDQGDDVQVATTQQHGHGNGNGNSNSSGHGNGSGSGNGGGNGNGRGHN
jgi:hypothetical protein